MGIQRNSKLLLLVLLCCIFILKITDNQKPINKEIPKSDSEKYVPLFMGNVRRIKLLNNTEHDQRTILYKNLHYKASSPIDEESFTTEIKERLERRHKRVQEKCESGTSDEDMYDAIKKRYYIFYNHNAGVCLIGKAGSSSWREHLRQVNSGPPATVEIFYDPRRKEFFNRTEEQILKDVGSQRSILTVRHPLTRLVSAWKNKYNHGNRLEKYKSQREDEVHKRIFTPSWSFNVATYWLPALASNGQLPSDIHSKLRLAAPLNLEEEYPLWVYTALRKLLKPSINFNQFLNHVIKTFNTSTADPHWNVFSHECAPCSLLYDYIAKVETYSEDLEYIFRQIGINSDPKSHRNITNKKKDDPYAYLSYYTRIPLIIRKTLYGIYRKDMDMFGYDLPDWFLKEEAQ